MRILLADDDLVTRQLISRTLQNNGYSVETAADGQEAWEWLLREFFPVLIADWMMPRVNGIELIRRVRSHTFRGYVYIIILTARNRRADRLTGLTSGADDFLTKPVDPAELDARLAIARRILDLETRLREANARLSYQATHDQLTDLLNRRAITDYARIELARAQHLGYPLSLALFDLDHFKEINDRYGHKVGDIALCHVAERMAAGLRASDRIGRWGGEEFLAILPNATTAEALCVVERVRRNLAEEPLILPEGQIVTITLSAGVTSDGGRPDVQIDRLFQEADNALYAAKAAGRNCVRCAWDCDP